MNSIKYAKAFKETTEYLKGIRQDDFDKIPEEIRNFLYENQSKDYECNLDYTVPFKDMEIMEETKGIILYLCYNYWCENESEKQVLISKLNENEIKFQTQLKAEFEKNETLNKTKANSDSLPAKSEDSEKERKKFSIFTKILEFIKKLKKNN